MFSPFKIFLIAVWTISFPLSAFSEKDPPFHHMFNADLMGVGSEQLSIYGNFKMGLSENWELGTQGAALLLGQVPNIAYKHAMFQIDTTKIAFTGHSFFNSQKPNGYLLSHHGIIASSPIQEGQMKINYGLFHSLALGKSEFLSRAEIHLLSPHVGLDYRISEKLFLTTFLTTPSWFFGELNTDYLDLEGKITFFTLDKIIHNNAPYLLFASVTKAFESFNVEFGLIKSNSSKGNLYLNLFWRY